MKILVILNDLDIGGAQNYTISLMNEFIKMGHTISLRILSTKIPLILRLRPEIDVKEWPRKHKFDIKVINNIRFEIKQGDYDGIISSYVIYQKLATLCLNEHPITIYPIHSTVERDKKAFIFNYITYRFKRKNEVYLTSIDNQTKYLLSAYKLRDTYFHQIYNGVDTEKFSFPPTSFNRIEFLRKIGISPNDRIVLMVAGYRKEKRHIDAIKAFEILNKEMKNVTLVCVGDNRDKERNELQQYINRNKIGNIILLSASEAGDVRYYYWSADVFTLTSNKVETFPISVLEAMSCGLPCVLTDTGGAKDIIKNNKNGFIVRIESPEAIAGAWKEILTNKNNFEKSEIRGFVENNYSIVNSAKQYLNLIQKLNVN